MTGRAAAGLALLSALAALVACATSTGSALPTPEPSPSAAARTSPTPTGHPLRRLPPNGRFDYQIGGPYTPLASVAAVDRDRHEAAVPGRFNVCYVNAFQSQPEEASLWTRDHPDLLARRHGSPVTDRDWPGEYLLDTSTAVKRQALLGIVGPWVDSCATSGYDAVEPDNLDSWTRSRGALTRDGNLAFARLLVDRAHAHGLVVAQKNTVELGTLGRTQVGFDLAVAEECQVYDECDRYTDVYGDQVVEIEYTDQPRSAYTDACRARGARISVVLRDRDVLPRGRRGYVYEEC